MDRLSVNETAIDRLEINLQQDCFESSCIFAHLRLTGKEEDSFVDRCRLCNKIRKNDLA